MKINKLRFVGGNTVDFPMVGANPAGAFILKGVDGLGSPEVTVNIKDTIQEGGVFQSKRAANRQVVALVGLQPEWDVGQTPEELRDILYALMTPKFGEPAMIQAMLDSTVVGQAEGYVSKIEPSIFTSDPEVQITLDTLSPYLKGPSVTYQNPVKSVSGGLTYFDVANVGNAPTGFYLSMTLGSAFNGSIQLLDESPTGQRMVVEGISWAAGDRITFDTRDRQRGVWRTPVNTAGLTSILNNLTDDSSWLQMHAGDNRFRTNLTNFQWYLPGFTFTPTYWGV